MNSHVVQATVTRGPAAAGTWRHVAGWEGAAMGGLLRILLTVPGEDGAAADGQADARRRAAAVARRVSAWAARLTRFHPASELMRLNDANHASTAVGPTLGAVLAWADQARQASRGIVDVTLLTERLAAERDVPLERSPTDALAWRITRAGRRALVERSQPFAFDLDGVAKGWIADRALALLTDFAGAIVDADGDLALAVAPGDNLEIGVADPFRPGRIAAVLRVPATSPPRRQTLGIATSGISVHRWGTAGNRGPRATI